MSSVQDKPCNWVLITFDRPPKVYHLTQQQKDEIDGMLDRDVDRVKLATGESFRAANINHFEKESDYNARMGIGRGDNPRSEQALLEDNQPPASEETRTRTRYQVRAFTKPWMQKVVANGKTMTAQKFMQDHGKGAERFSESLDRFKAAGGTLLYVTEDGGTIKA